MAIGISDIGKSCEPFTDYEVHDCSGRMKRDRTIKNDPLQSSLDSQGSMNTYR